MAIHTIVLQSPRKNPKSKPRQKPTMPKPSSGFQLLRNKEGVLYFRWPHDDSGSTKLVTYHIYPRGETYLRGRGVGQDDGLPVSLALEVKDLGYLYTGKGVPRLGDKARTGLRRERPLTRVAYTGAIQIPPKTNNQPNSNQSHRRGVENSRRESGRVHLFKPAAGMLVFRVRAVAMPPEVQSRPFPKPEVRLRAGLAACRAGVRRVSRRAQTARLARM